MPLRDAREQLCPSHHMKTQQKVWAVYEPQEAGPHQTLTQLALSPWTSEALELYKKKETFVVYATHSTELWYSSLH